MKPALTYPAHQSRADIESRWPLALIALDGQCPEFASSDDCTFTIEECRRVGTEPFETVNAHIGQMGQFGWSVVTWIPGAELWSRMSLVARPNGHWEPTGKEVLGLLNGSPLNLDPILMPHEWPEQRRVRLANLATMIARTKRQKNEWPSRGVPV